MNEFEKMLGDYLPEPGRSGNKDMPYFEPGFTPLPADEVRDFSGGERFIHVRIRIQEPRSLEYCAFQMQREQSRKSGRSADGFDPARARKRTRDRWCVNYIRHCLFLEYDYVTSLFRWDAPGVYYEFKSFVLDCIAEAYPQYADECERQKTSLS